MAALKKSFSKKVLSIFPTALDFTSTKDNKNSIFLKLKEITKNNSQFNLQINGAEIITKNKLFLSKRSLKTFVTNFGNIAIDTSSGYFIRIFMKGIGFRFQPYKSGFKNSIAFDLGYTHYIQYFLPTNVFVRRVRKYEFVVFGFDRRIITSIAEDIQSFYYPDSYKGKGIHYEGEDVRTKTRVKDVRRR